MEDCNMKPIETEIISALNRIPEKLGIGERDGIWTREVKDAIGGLGESNGFLVCASGFPERFDREWLYDLIWYKNNEEGQLEEVFLTLESEWSLNFRNIKYDFEKLLVANSEYKLMIFQDDGDTINEVFLKLRDGIKAFGDTAKYILAGYNWEKQSFEIKNQVLADL